MEIRMAEGRPRVNVLLLSPWLPWPPFGGSLIRIWETLRYLSRRHRVTLLTPLRHPDEGEHVPTVSALCEQVITTQLSDRVPATIGRLGRNLVRGMPFIQGLHYDPNLARHVARLTSERAYDVLHVEASSMAPYVAAVSPRSRVRRILTAHNIESLRFVRELQFAPPPMRRLALLTDHLLFRAWEERALRSFDGIVAVSAVELAWIRRHAPAATVVLAPNGVDVSYFSTDEHPGSSRTIAFTGLMNYPPNIDAATWFCDEVFPLVQREHPRARFKIVGDKPDPVVMSLAKREGVQVTGRVPDVRPHLADAVASVIPLRSGAGTRLKILEAMAMRRPVVSTALGAEGLAVTPGVDILLGNTARELADHLCALLTDSALGERLGRAGRHLVESRYDWPICLEGLDTLYQEFGADPRAGRGTGEMRIPGMGRPR
jgi:sugar transferase (PEP-CTERM/EpsH1 system associated)